MANDSLAHHMLRPLAAGCCSDVDEYDEEEPANVAFPSFWPPFPALSSDSDSDADAAGWDGGMSASISQLLLHVDISKPGAGKSLQFLCGLYPDAVGIHSVCLRSKDAESWEGNMASKGGAEYRGRIFQ